MADSDIIGGYHGHVNWIDEATSGVTPDDDAWDWLGDIIDVTPVFNPNEQKITGVGERTYSTRLDGGWDASLKATLNPRTQTNLLDWLTMAMGSATANTNGRLPTKSIEVWQLREGTPDWYLANLYNQVKTRQLTLEHAWGVPTKLSADLVCQAIQDTLDSSETPNWFSSYEGLQGTGGDPLTIGSRVAKPAATVKPYNFTNFSKPTIDYGAGPLELPPKESWSLQISNTLIPIPGTITGADDVEYPWVCGYAEEALTLQMAFGITPQTLEIYQKWLSRSHLIDASEFTITHPTGSGALASTDIALTGGGWDVADYQLKELVLNKQPLTATFNGITRLDVSP